MTYSGSHVCCLGIESLFPAPKPLSSSLLCEMRSVDLAVTKVPFS